MNRFTEALLSIEPLENDYVLWRDIEERLNYLILPASSLETPWFFSSDETYIENKLTLVCLLATLSDEDLFEIFGI